MLGKIKFLKYADYINDNIKMISYYLYENIADILKVVHIRWS